MYLIGSRAVEYLNNIYSYSKIRLPEKNAEYDILANITDLNIYIYNNFSIIKKLRKINHNKYKLCLMNDKIFNIEIIETGTSSELIEEYIKNSCEHNIIIDNMEIKIADINLLYILKKSYISKKWHNYINDYHYFKIIYDQNKKNELLDKILTIRTQENLVKKEYIKLKEKLILEYVKSEEKLEEKLKEKLEELCMALTIEMYLLPNYNKSKSKYNYKKLYMRTLKDICISYIDADIREKTLDNYFNIQNCPKDLNNICSIIYIDIYEGKNILAKKDIFLHIFKYLDAKDIYNLSIIDSYMYKKLNTEYFVKLYISSIGIETGIIKNYNIGIISDKIIKTKLLKKLKVTEYEFVKSENILPYFYYKISQDKEYKKISIILVNSNKEYKKYKILYNFTQKIEISTDDDSDNESAPVEIINKSHTSTVYENGIEILKVNYFHIHVDNEDDENSFDTEFSNITNKDSIINIIIFIYDIAQILDNQMEEIRDYLIDELIV